MHCQITVGLPEGRRAEGDAEGAAEKEKRPVTVVTISSIGYHQPPQTVVSLSSVSFFSYDHIHSLRKIILLLFLLILFFFLPSTRFLGVLSVYILEKFACTLRLGTIVVSSPRDLLSFLSSLVEIIRKMKVFLPWRKVRSARRSRRD